MPARRLERAVAAGFAGWALARVAAADRLRLAGPYAASLLSFTPHAAAAAWLGALALRDDRAAAVSATAAGTLTAVVAPRALRHRQPGATGPALRVVTANLLIGRADAEPVVELARETAADVLFLQEVSPAAAARLRRAGLDDLLPHAVTDLGLPGSRGNGIYARYPLADCPEISATPWARPAVTLELPARVVRLVCVHLRSPKPPWKRPGASDWQRELRALAALLTRPAPGEPPVVVAGDFNSTLDHAAFRRLLRRGFRDAANEAGRGLVPTWGPRAGGSRSLVAIDHVLADSRCAVSGAAVRRLAGTDHRAVVAAIRLPG